MNALVEAHFSTAFHQRLEVISSGGDGDGALPSGFIGLASDASEFRC